MSDREITICRDRADLAKKAADYFVVLANEGAAETGRFTVALSGGSTPKVLYSLLATPEYNQSIPWPRVPDREAAGA